MVFLFQTIANLLLREEEEEGVVCVYGLLVLPLLTIYMFTQFSVHISWDSSTLVVAEIK